MKQILILLSLISLTCCKSRKYDDVPEGNYPSKHWSYVVEKNKVIVMNRNTIKAGGDGIYYAPQNYDISVPRKIVSHSSSNSSNFINYGNSQLIIVDANYKRENFKRTNWEVIVDQRRVIGYIEDFYSISNKKFNYDREISKQKLYSLYFDGQTYILFYNIKDTTKFDRKQILNSFHYIE